MHNEPQWAKELLLLVCKDEGRNPTRTPYIDWKVSKANRYSSGHYQPLYDVITIKAGHGGTDHKQVFLHEVAHWLTKPRGWKAYGKRRVWHGKRFYKKLNELLVRYSCWSQENKERENNYMKRSVYYL